ncbi:xanthine dehydrogenase accessory factor [Rhodobium orientis]|uniref:Xanthine dehydrogenase accessory protein XdhC n=1 Tax=Rhodobium orientis TaxID=34017 RepID=A0A327JK49_9HYPH|nr:xanthine dehydrogenase accessory protein XdhC [Rhodobium orientis]MBB4301869.1 xanthine dehydrogenase accessory factor [Rhodobium orientis]MBK5950107.1 xanthine dehydrogenase accessory protein XdhC [Rhodobium orientis]RAI25663.1 xanthine dehydrogenase accessory protein XdhC [Rhodobium orientis]
MIVSPAALDAFLAANDKAALVRLAAAKGSTPRAAGTWMLVSHDAMLGTIGGGQMEFLAIDAARKLLAEKGSETPVLDLALGPEIGQCCGGKVTLHVSLLGADDEAAIRAEVATNADALPSVFVFGAGHVGRALVKALALLPVRAVLVDSRQEELDRTGPDAEKRLTALPEEVVRAARAGSAFVVMTHEHSLDFLIVRETLLRGDAAYVGMIGSKTKRASFERYCARQDSAVDAARLVCPIGAQGSRDKRPEVIAAFVAAEVIATLPAEAGTVVSEASTDA